MRKQHGRRAHLALGLAASAVLVIASGGLATAAAGATTGRATSTCTDSWVGKAFTGQWTTASNWSTGQVPGPASDVCIITRSGVEALASASITIHSLQLGNNDGVALTGTQQKPVDLTAATSIQLTGQLSEIRLTSASVNAATIDNSGLIITNGTCGLTSPDIAFGGAGSLQAADGTTTLSSLSQLSNGTLTGVHISTFFTTSTAVVVLPGDVTHLVHSGLQLGANSAIEDPAGQNALTGLTSIDALSSLDEDSNLTLAGGLTDSGELSLDGVTMALGGPLSVQGRGSVSTDGNTVLHTSQVTLGMGAGLVGQGVITGNLVNQGELLPSGISVPILQVDGNYTQTQSGMLLMSRPHFAVTGRATLAGFLSIGEFDTGPGNSEPVLTFGSLSGGFGQHSVGFSLVTKAHEIDASRVPQIVARHSTVAPGQTVLVAGGSFGNDSKISIFLDSTGGTPLRTLVPSNGHFVDSVTIPASATAGQHTLIAVGSGGDRATATITVS
jgi:hypothetical protein